MKKLLLFAAAGLVYLSANAQDENLLHSFGKPVSRKISQANMFFAGVESSTVPTINTQTKDSNTISVYTGFYFNYQHKSNLGLSVKTYLLPGGSDPGFYLTTLTPYYANYKGEVIPYISYTRYITHNNPSVPYSPIQNDIYAHLRFKTKVVDPIFGLNAGFGKDEQNNNESVNDFNAFAAISHVFTSTLGVNKSDILAIIPTLQLNAGTDRYFKFLRTTKYLSQNRSPQQIGYGRRRGSGGNGTQTVEQYYLTSENTFAISNLEANINLMYFTGSFSIEPSGSLFFPLRGDDRTIFGYWQININYWFR